MGYSAEVLADGPELYWQLHDSVGSTTAADSSGNGHTGTVTTDLDTQEPEFGHPALLAGGNTCLSFPPLNSSDHIRSNNVGPGTNFSVEVVIRPHSIADYQFVVVKPGALTCIISVVAGPSSNPGAFIGVDVAPTGIQSRTVGMDMIPVGQRTHVVWEYTGTPGVIGAGGPRLKIYVDNTLILDEALATTEDLDYVHETNYVQISGYGLFVEHFAVYHSVLSTTRIAAHMAQMGDVATMQRAIETDLSGQIGYPRTFDIGQAPSPFFFDPTQPLPPNLPQAGTGETAQRIRSSGKGAMIGQAVETDTADQMAVEVIPWTTLDLSEVDFHTSPTPEDFGFYADGLIQPNTFGTGPGIAFTHPAFGLDDLDANTYYDIEVTFDAASEYTFAELTAYLDDSDDQWWNESPFDLDTFGAFTATPRVIRATIGPADDVEVFGQWDEAFAANYQSINFFFSNRSYISQLRWRVSGYVSPTPPVPPPIEAVGPVSGRTRTAFPPRRVAAR